MATTVLLRLIDKNAFAPTPIVDILNGDLREYQGSIEFTHTSVNKVSSCLVKIPIRKDGKFVRTAPILMDENAKRKYLLEFRLTQGANVGKLFRGEIGEPTIIEDEFLGEVISIPCEAIERAAREVPVSRIDRLASPKDRFINIITDYEQSRGTTGGTIFGFLGGNPDNVILLPGSLKLKQLWEPFGPAKTKDLLNEVITRLEEAPQVGGTLLDYFYDFEASPSFTRKTDVFAQEFGLVDSGVTVNPLTVGGPGAETEKKISTDNISYKNVIIAKGDPQKGTLPANMQRFRSLYLHAIAREIWSAATTYAVGDLVKRQFPGSFPDERFFKSRVNNNLAQLPEISPAFWEEDFSINPASSIFFSPSPWTSNLTSMSQNIIGKGNGGISTYAGFFFDWNVERTLYERSLSQDFWQRLSVKSVFKRANSPPLRIDLFDGYRIILGTFTVSDPQINPGFEGLGVTVNGVNAFTPSNRGRILEYNGDPNGVQGLGKHSKDTNANGWILSDAPTDTGSGTNRTQDTATDLETAKVLKWDKNARGGTGNWVDAWDISANADKSSPFHICKSVQLVAGATGIPNQAFEARFNWRNFGTNNPWEAANGDLRNGSSRGVWLSGVFPYPYITAGQGVGALYGKNRAYPFLDTFNLNRTADGSVGWNNGLKSEDLGRVNGIHFKLKVGFFETQDDSARTLGVANIPMVFWAMDKFGRVYYQEFSQRVNNAWEDHTLVFGPRAPQSYFYSRFDELAEFFGYKLPFNFFLREREYTGIEFDWRFVKYWGIFSKHMYSDDSGHYLGGFEQYLKETAGVFEQLGQKALLIVAKIFGKAGDVPLTDKFVVDHSTIAIDELFFTKELYASSRTGVEPDPRTEIIHAENIQDWFTLKAKAIATQARKEFFPQFWHITVRGDVRLKLGQRFKIAGPRVPGGGPIELVIAEATQRVNQDGFTTEIFGVRKFVKTA